VGGLNDFEVASKPHHPCWEEGRGKFRLGVTRGEANNQPFELALRDSIEFFPDNPVMAALYKIGPLTFDKFNKVFLANFLFFDPFVSVEQGKRFLLLLLR